MKSRMDWATLNKIKRFPILIFLLLIYPIKIIFAPFMLFVFFFITDWENEVDRNLTIRIMKNNFKPFYWS